MVSVDSMYLLKIASCNWIDNFRGESFLETMHCTSWTRERTGDGWLRGSRHVTTFPFYFQIGRQWHCLVTTFPFSPLTAVSISSYSVICILHNFSPSLISSAVYFLFFVFQSGEPFCKAKIKEFIVPDDYQQSTIICDVLPDNTFRNKERCKFPRKE